MDKLYLTKNEFILNTMKFFLALVAALSALVLFASPSLAIPFNITFSTPTLNSSTPNQLFNVSIGNNDTGALGDIIEVNISYFSYDGVVHVSGTNFTSGNATNVSFTNVTEFPKTVLIWKNTTTTSGLILLNEVRNFSINLGTPLSSSTLPIGVSVRYANGNPQASPGLFVPLIQPSINAIVNLRGPSNNSVYPFNSVNVSFNVTGDSNFYACVVFNNQTTPFGSLFVPSLSPPNFNVSNNTNANITVYLPFGLWKWNVRCMPKDSYTAVRTPAGYNVTKNGLPSSLNSFKIGDLVNFTNIMPSALTITFAPPMSQPYTINLSVNGSAIIDTSPDFSNPSSPKPPLMGPFSDNATDQFSSSVLGGFGQSGDPRFAPGVFAAANFTLNVTGPDKPSFDPGNFFGGTGFNFDAGPCSPSASGPKPAFCFPNASGGVAFQPNNVNFFSEHPDFTMSGFTDCSRPSNANQPDCKLIFNPTAQITGDATAPNLLFTKAGAFSDKVFLDFGTDEMSNMTLDYYGGDQYCGSKLITLTDEGVINPQTGLLITNSRFKPFHHFEISSSVASNVSISSNSTYYYKNNICDRAGNCLSSSSCKSFNSSTTLFANTPVNINFTIPSGFNFKFRFPNGTEATIGSTTNFANLTNVTMKFAPTNANWGIDLPASAMATASSFDFSSGFKSVTSGGKTFVGMNKTVWDGLAQRLGITSVNITIVGTGDTLNKCDDDGANCNDVTSLGVKVFTNSSAGTATWTIPVTLGFSTYVDAPASSSSPSTTTSSSTSGGSVGSTTTAQKTAPKGKVLTIPSVAAGGSAVVSIDKSEGAGFTQISISAKNDLRNVQIVVTKLDGKPASVASAAPAGKLYSYVEVNETNVTQNDVSGAKISFYVEKTWLSSNNVDESTVALYRYAGSAWDKLDTSKVGEDSDGLTFEAESPGLSEFAIGGEAKSQAAAPEQPTAQPAPEAAAPTPASYWIVLVIVVIVVIAAAAFLLSKKKK